MGEQDELAELRYRIEQGRIAVEQDVNHGLNFGRVMSILAMYGPRLKYGVISVERAHELGVSPKEHRAALRGWQRRAWNALLCAEKILPFWSVEVVAPYLSSQEVQQLRRLNMENRIVNAKVAVLLEEQCAIREFEPSGDNLLYELAKQRKQLDVVDKSTGVYKTIEQILIIVCVDEPNTFDPERIYPEKWERDDVHWEGYPSVVYASFAYGGTPNKLSGALNDPYARREFWLWWLDEAVLASWHLEELSDDC